MGCVERAEGGAYGRTERGKEFQKHLDWELQFDDYTQGAFYR